MNLSIGEERKGMNINIIIWKTEQLSENLFHQMQNYHKFENERETKFYIHAG
jgi:hypothetical protein